MHELILNVNIELIGWTLHKTDYMVLYIIDVNQKIAFLMNQKPLWLLIMNCIWIYLIQNLNPMWINIFFGNYDRNFAMERYGYQ